MFKVEHIQRCEEQLIGGTEREQHRLERRNITSKYGLCWCRCLVSAHPCIVEPHDWIGGEISHLVTCFTVNQRAVHLNPVATNVQSNNQLEPKHTLGVEQTECHDKTCC